MQDCYRGQKFHLSASSYERNLGRTSNSWQDEFFAKNYSTVKQAFSFRQCMGYCYEQLMNLNGKISF